MNQCRFKPDAIYINFANDCAKMLEGELELHLFNKPVTQTSARVLCKKMRLTYANVKLNFQNVSRVSTRLLSDGLCSNFKRC